MLQRILQHLCAHRICMIDGRAIILLEGCGSCSCGFLCNVDRDGCRGHITITSCIFCHRNSVDGCRGCCHCCSRDIVVISILCMPQKSLSDMGTWWGTGGKCNAPESLPSCKGRCWLCRISRRPIVWTGVCPGVRKREDACLKLSAQRPPACWTLSSRDGMQKRKVQRLVPKLVSAFAGLASSPKIVNLRYIYRYIYRI